MTVLVKLEETTTEKNIQNMLTATMSHEMRNPLNAMLSMHDVLNSYIPSEEGRLNLKISRNSCIFLLTLIEDMQDYCQIKQGAFVKKETWFNLR